MLDFFEGVVLYADQNDVDEDKIYNAFSDWVEYYWVAGQSATRLARDEKRGSDYCEKFEKTYKGIVIRQARETGKQEDALSPEDNRDFLTEEKSLTD